MKTYPICLINLNQKRVVVIGGGQVALRKARGLLDAGAIVHLISPVIENELRELSQTEQINLEQRDYQSGDLFNVFLVIAATDDPTVNQAIWDEAQKEGCLINVVDDPPHCNFILPAVVRRGDLNIAISTGGSSPALARRIREELETEFGPEYDEFTAILGEVRRVLLSNYPPGEERLNAALQLVDSDLKEVLKEVGYEKAKQYALELLSPENHNV